MYHRASRFVKENGLEQEGILCRKLRRVIA
jgi:hypothetical protein